MNALPIKFVSTTFEGLNDVELTPGAIITLIDRTGLYYDTETKRHKVNLIEFIPSIEGRTGEENTLYFCTGNNVIYYWADGKFNSAIGQALTSAPNDGRQYVQKNGEWQTLDFRFECIDLDSDGYNLWSMINLITNSDNINVKIQIIGNGSGLVARSYRISVPAHMTLTLDFSECSIPDNVEIAANWMSNIGEGNLNIVGLSLVNCLIDPYAYVLSGINMLDSCEIKISRSTDPEAITINSINSAHHCKFINCRMVTILRTDYLEFSNNVVEDTLVKLCTRTGYDTDGEPIYKYTTIDPTMNNSGTPLTFSTLSWEQIRILRDDGSLGSLLSIGESKEFTINGELWTAKIIDKYKDTKSMGSGKYQLTLMCYKNDEEMLHAYSLDGECRYTHVTYEGSLRQALHRLIDGIDDVDMQDLIKESVATKICNEFASDDMTVFEPRSFDDYVWPFSADELKGGTYNHSSEGSRYQYFEFVDPLDVPGFYFWTRTSTVSSDTPMTVRVNINYYSISQANTSKPYGVLFGICI